MAFHAPKESKKEKAESNLYTIHDYSGSNLLSVSDTIKSAWSTCDWIQVVSIDPAIGNIGIRIERRYTPNAKNGYNNIIPLVLHKFNIKPNTDTQNHSSMYSLLVHTLDQYKNLYSECHVVIIERQFNYQSTRVMQFMISYFMELFKTYNHKPYIIELDSKAKSEVLGAPKGMNRTSLKKWDTEMAYRYLRSRGDVWSISILDSYKTKIDDLSDSIVQIEAFCNLVGLPCTTITYNNVETKQWCKHLEQWNNHINRQ